MKTGTDAIAELIEASGWSYPVSVHRLEEEHAFKNIELDAKGNSIMLAELLTDIDSKQIDDRDDLESTFAPVIEQRTEERQVGIFGKIKRSFYR